MKNLLWIAISASLAVAGCKDKKKEGGPAPDPVAKPDPGPALPPVPAPAPTPAPVAAKPAVIFAAAPAGWDIGDGVIETAVAVNQSDFPVDNAPFAFEYGVVDAKDVPWPQYEGVRIKSDKKLANGHYYETGDAFRYEIDAGDKRIWCGGSLYNDKDHDKIAKVRDEVVGTAKKLCEGAKL